MTYIPNAREKEVTPLYRKAGETCKPEPNPYWEGNLNAEDKARIMEDDEE